MTRRPHRSDIKRAPHDLHVLWRPPPERDDARGLGGRRDDTRRGEVQRHPTAPAPDSQPHGEHPAHSLPGFLADALLALHLAAAQWSIDDPMMTADLLRTALDRIKAAQRIALSAALEYEATP